MSAVIAAEAMRRLPRMQRYGAYPENTRFGDFRVSYEENSGVLAASDAYLNAGATQVAPPRPSQLTRVAGYGSSPVVTYEGEGIYFLDRLAGGVWRLEVYPDAVPVADPFEPPSPDKIVTRSIARSWPMTIRLPDLGASFAVEAIARGNARPTRAEGGRFTVTPGVYLLGARGAVDRAKLPSYVGHLRLDEFRAPATDSAALAVVPRSATTFVTGAPLDVAVDVVSATLPDSVTLSVRHAGAGWFRRYAMRAGAGYEYSARLPADSLGEGPIEYAVTVVRGDSATTFPEGLHQRPWDWNFHGRELWTGTVVSPTTPLRLFSAG
ncbi:MAG TPA: hypothetical protein VFJ78_04820, partial [Gaiellaceae bacterium]|nr:hypothetical protein [Gaiellaceae bacterium]